MAKQSRDAERAERRRQREVHAWLKENAKMHAAMEKEAAKRYAAAEVEAYDLQMSGLLTLQRECGRKANWKSRSRARPPEFKAPGTPNTDAAQRQLEGYRPGFFEKLFGGAKKRQAELVAAVSHAKVADERLTQSALASHGSDMEAWKDAVAFAKLILSNDAGAFKEAVEQASWMSELEELGCKTKVVFDPSMIAHAVLTAPGEEVVPTEVKTLNAKGAVATKQMPKAKALETYQDFLCGAALRVARELTALLPLRAVLVEVYVELLNSSSGHFERSCVLSVYCPVEGLAKIDSGRADPSDAIGRFKSAMAFSRGKGMSKVKPFPLSEFASPADEMPSFDLQLSED